MKEARHDTPLGQRVTSCDEGQSPAVGAAWQMISVNGMATEFLPTSWLDLHGTINPVHAMLKTS